MSSLDRRGAFLTSLEPSSPEQLEPRWFAAYTLPRHEKRVEQYLALRALEHYLPLYHVKHRWRDGSTALLDLPLFPGYLFVRIPQAKRARVLEVPGVVMLVSGPGGKPIALPDAEIEGLRNGLSCRNPEPHRLLTAGQRARIRSGALAGMEGVVVRQKSRLRMILTLDLLLQSIAVEVDGNELEPLAPGSGPGYVSGPGNAATSPSARNL